jgi:hypothetical protein
LAIAVEEPTEAADQIEAALGLRPQPPVTLAQLRGPVILLMPGALPRPHGPRCLLDALAAGAVLACADEAELLPCGGLANPWCKPPSPSPLLAAQGGLLGRLVAADASHTEVQEMLRQAARPLRGLPIGFPQPRCALCRPWQR